ncbi:MAG: outer membrane lipoprotein carrier protein LolA [Chitinophagaceae bacterium]
MIKNIIAAITLCLFLGQTASFAQDAKAKGILESASKKMSSLKTLKANFTLKLLGKTGNVRETQKGTMMMKGNKYRISLAKQEIICDGKTVWTLMKDAKEVQVSNYNPEEQSISPTKLFTNFYDKEYNYHYVGSKKIAGKPCDVIEMTPKSSSKQFSKVELAFDKNSTIAGGTISEKNGNQYAYEVSGFSTNPPIAESQFAYDAKAHPGVELVDLR